MIRSMALSKGFLSLGHTVDFITIPISESHVQTDKYDFIDNMNIYRTHKNTIYDTVVTKSNSGLKSKLVNLLKKVYHKFTLYNYTYSIAKGIDISMLKNREYDVLISISDPKTSHIAMNRLIKSGLKYKKWIQYLGDPMTIDITRKSIYPNWVIKNVEKKIIKPADKIIYVSPLTLGEQKKLFPSFAHKMSFLPVPYISKKYFATTKNKKFTVGYFGAYPSKVRDIIPLYNAGKKMEEAINLNIVGDTDLVLDETANIKVYPRGDISNFEKDADLLICILNKTGTQIPGKVYHYASTNKPVLVLLDGENRHEIRDYLDSFNRFIICNNNTEEIIKTIKSIMNSTKEYQPSNEFHPEKIAQEFLN